MLLAYSKELTYLLIKRLNVGCPLDDKAYTLPSTPSNSTANSLTINQFSLSLATSRICIT